MLQLAKRTRRAITLTVLFLIAAALTAGYARRYVADRLLPVNPGAQEQVVVEIPRGTSTQGVADLLYAKQLIKDPVVFRYYARYLKLDSQLKSGEYQLSAAMSPEQILAKITRGETYIRRFTVPEGLTVEQVADVLAEKQVVNREKFLKAAKASKLADAYLPKDVKLAQPLEGYLFPSTYEYRPGSSEEEILEMMFARFEKAWTPALRAKAKELGLTIHEATTLASIIEKEAQAAPERVIISGVYHNRLEIGMKLDADPTVRYAVSKPVTEDLTLKDLAFESPYNTYRSPGLPPGPIAAPGDASIAASVTPQKHYFWFFVAKEDGSGEHYFADTLDKQDDNIALARANAEKRTKK